MSRLANLRDYCDCSSIQVAVMRRLAFLALCLLVGTCSAQTSEESEKIFLRNYQHCKKFGEIFSPKSEPYYQHEAAINASGISPDEILVSDVEGQGAELECVPLSESFIKTTPTSVHALSPYHIKVMGAVGDSVTAGFGALSKSVFTFMTEYRGVSWSIGGDEDLSTFVTLPNIIKKFNSNVQGFSVKTGKASSSNSRLNRAISGAVAADIPDQVEDLIKKIKGDKSIDIDEDWKLITVWIGGNDLCRYCNDKEKKSPDEYVRHIKKGLDRLKSELPRTFVNLVQILDVTKLAEVQSISCGLIHLFACSCTTNSKDREITVQAFKDYNTKLEEMIDDGHYHDKDDFTVVLQPFYKEVKLPADARSFFGVDCFHFNGKGHAVAARSLWNNMMEPVGRKTERVAFGEEPALKCPTEEFPYFFTHKNSESLSLSSFGAVGPEPDSSNNDNPTNLLAILLGTGLTAFVIAMAVVVSVVGVVYARHRRQRRHVSAGTSVGISIDTEKTRLIFKQ